MNARNAPLLGQEDIKIFEIGNVFKEGEHEQLHLAFGFYSTKSIKHKEKVTLETVEKMVKDLGEKLGVELTGVIESSEAGVVFELDLGMLIETLPEPKVWDIALTKDTQTYKPFSPYPFALRDIAVFTPEGTEQTEPLTIIQKEAGAYLARHMLFDVFTKQFPDGTKKTSYAFRMVFQSYERTLTEEEINDIMKRITDAMNAKEGWQVR
jgi:phenylalanyl-tRNA synthetase beta subunit